MQAELSLHIRLQQKLFADPRRIELLKRVQETGSISQGAKLGGYQLQKCLGRHQRHESDG